jgi:aryl carrier-like protein
MSDPTTKRDSVGFRPQSDAYRSSLRRAHRTMTSDSRATMLRVDGKAVLLAEAAAKLGVDRVKLMVRVRARRRAGVDLTWENLAATGASLARQRRAAQCKVDGVLLTVAEIAGGLGVSGPTARAWIQVLKDRRSRLSWQALRDVGVDRADRGPWRSR